MADSPFIYPAKQIEHGFSVSTAMGVLVTCGAADTKGAWTEIVSASNNTENSDNVAVELFPQHSINEAHRNYLVDVALGEAGSEHVIIANLGLIGTQAIGDEANGYIYNLPLKIPAGVRISVRGQSSLASSSFHALIRRLVGGYPGFGKTITVGADTSDTSGVNATVTSAGSWQAWVEMTSSLSENIKGFVISRIKEDSSWTNGALAMQIGVGSAGNEVVIAGPYTMVTNGANETMTLPTTPFLPIPIASGERVSVRAAATDVAVTDFNFEYILYGVI